jgi:hypothetical protein
MLLVLKIHQTQKNLLIHRILRKIIKSIFMIFESKSYGSLFQIFFLLLQRKNKK